MSHITFFHLGYTKALLRLDKAVLVWWNSLSRMSKGDNVRLYATLFQKHFSE